LDVSWAAPWELWLVVLTAVRSEVVMVDSWVAQWAACWAGRLVPSMVAHWVDYWDLGMAGQRAFPSGDALVSLWAQMWLAGM